VSDPVLGMLDLETLEREIAEGTIETVITALPDLYGRLVGKRIHGRFFLEEVVNDGMHVCNYLLACDMEMVPSPGAGSTDPAPRADRRIRPPSS
jgi:glutamine synthetase